jgi:hypothetical protein
MARPATQDRLVILGCRVREMVVVVARAATARVLLVVTVTWAGIEGSGVAALGSLLWGRHRRRRVGAQCGGTQHGICVEETSISDEILSDQVKVGGKNCVGKMFNHLTLFPIDLASVSSPMNSSVTLLKARALIMCLYTNFID